MQITVDIPDDMARQLESLKDELPQILALGLLQVKANPSTGFSGLAEVLEFLATLPSPQETLALRLSDTAQAQIEALLEKNRVDGLTALEQRLWQQYEFVEHLVRMAKAQALLKLQEVA
ncbi:MAG: hypothetical protein IGR76_10390 [Synechococcales cyanobacterium T60_A2020_003]|nr:hypothetical protein [Synechococcales cyanobacterium T60_A2020_003]